MPAVMNDSKRNFFSGGKAEKNNEKQLVDNIYYEGQNVNDCVVTEERGYVKNQEKQKKRFLANYNMFF